MAKKLVREYLFSPGAAGVGYIEIPGRYTLDKLLLITNVTDNIIMYNFADATFAGTTCALYTANHADWPRTECGTRMWMHRVLFTLAARAGAQ